MQFADTGRGDGRREEPRPAVLYLHGKGGSVDEAAFYQPLFPACDVIGFDYGAQTPWEAGAEFPPFFAACRREYGSVQLIANSIGAYFAMCAGVDDLIRKAYFISPIVDMEQLILDMMAAKQVTEDDLKAQGEIHLTGGETLSWAYLSYVRAHPLRWKAPTSILYGGADRLTSAGTMAAFAKRIRADLTVMEHGAHWFHTQEELGFLKAWIQKAQAGDAKRNGDRHTGSGARRPPAE